MLAVIMPVHQLLNLIDAYLIDATLRGLNITSLDSPQKRHSNNYEYYVIFHKTKAILSSIVSKIAVFLKNYIFDEFKRGKRPIPG